MLPVNNNNSYVYLLEASPSGKTYVGATVDLNHRLRQHNGELRGGAHATTALLQKGETWHRVGHVSGFPDWIAALQFEWRWKQISRSSSRKRQKPLEKRLDALQTLLNLERATTKAVPFHEWPDGPPVWHDERQQL